MYVQVAISIIRVAAQAYQFWREEMGFRPEPTIYKLSFSGTALDGLTVRASCCSMREYNEMILDAVGTSDGSVADKNARLVQIFSKHLVEWDLEDPRTGETVPTTVEGIESQESAMMNQIISAWQIALVSVPPNLKVPSSDGGTSPEQSLDLAAASESQQSWPKPS
jgi:hypothetical protein